MQDPEHVMDASRATLDLMRRYWDAFLAGDLTGAIALWTDDIVLRCLGRSPLAGEYAGKSAAMAALVRIRTVAGRKTLGIRDLLVSDTRAAALVEERFERDGHAKEMLRVFLYGIRDGRIAEISIYDEDQQAVDEFLT